MLLQRQQPEHKFAVLTKSCPIGFPPVLCLNIKSGKIPSGQIILHLPHLIHCVEVWSSNSLEETNITDFTSFVTGVSILLIAKPVIIPFIIIFEGALLKPPHCFVKLCIGVPILTLNIPAERRQEPVT